MAKMLAVIGAGPKAAAIAAKAQVLRLLGRSDIGVTIFEAKDYAANWTGKHGYTDGHARLCTPAERDLGFPYDADLFDRDVALRMYREFSWSSYLVDHDIERFNDWVNRGRLPPSHEDFARYIEWAIRKSGAQFELGVVTAIDRTAGGWIIRRTRDRKSKRDGGPFAGVVFTGPGPAQSDVVRDGDSDRVTDGVAFWLKPAAFLKKGKGYDDPVVIIGAGGTAAAIAAWFVRAAPKKPVIIIGNQAALFTRSHTFFENQIFTDDQVWSRLNHDDRSEVTRRLNRGVVWANVSDELSRAPHVRFVPGRVDKIVAQAPEAGGDLTVLHHHGAKDNFAAASLVVDASGFDAWWFLKLLPTDLQAKAFDADPDKQTEVRKNLLRKMAQDFTLFNDPTGRVHAPMLSQAVGPGFSTLMVLGALSDRILKRY